MMQETMYRLFVLGEIRWRSIGAMMVGVALAAIALTTFKTTYDPWGTGYFWFLMLFPFIFPALLRAHTARLRDNSDNERSTK